MAQLHCYVPEALAQQAQRRAKQSGLSLSRYLAELVKRDAAAITSWPEGYFDIFGKWEGAPLERPAQLPLEERLDEPGQAHRPERHTHRRDRPRSRCHPDNPQHR